MPRPTFPRNIGFVPETTYFKPMGIRITDLEEVILGHDELEALRLKNLLHLSQDEAAAKMNVSQPTLHRLLSLAYEKLTDAIVNGKALRIEGGNISICEESLPACGGGRKCKKAELGRKAVPAQGAQPENPFGTGGEETSSKIVITSTDGTLDGMMDERFGRARMLIVYDLTTGTFTVLENSPQKNLPQEAGVRTARNVANLRVKAIISGHIGPKAFDILQTAGIQVYSALNISAADAVRLYREGNLTELPGADVDGRW